MNLSRLLLSPLLLAVTLSISAAYAAAVPNNWTSSSGGFWRYGTNWSRTSPPDNDSNFSPTQITNANTKTVIIDSSTATSNLTIRALNVSAPVGTTNTLLLSNLVAAFSASSTVNFSNRTALIITNSTVNLNGTLNMGNGTGVGGGATLTLHSGSVTGAGSCEFIAGNMTVNGGSLTFTAGTTGIRCGGFSGADSTFTVNNGTVSATRLHLGSSASSTANFHLNGGTVILDSVNSPDGVRVGHSANTTASANVNGGKFIATNGFSAIGIGSGANASFNQTGGETLFGDLTVGGNGTGVATYNLGGGTFNILPFQPTNLFIIGNLENGVFNQTGGVAIVHTETHIADWAGNGTIPATTGDLNISGGTYIATNDITSIGREYIGTMTVSNATVVLTNASVGRRIGSSGTLNIHSGANVSFVADLSIGRFAGAVGVANVTGGLLAVTNDDIWVGRGGNGTLNLSGGTINVRRLHVGHSDDGTNAPTGTLTMTGGNTFITSGFYVGTPNLSTGNVAFASGYLCATNTGTNLVEFLVSAGNFTLSGGTLDAEKISVTNTGGKFTFNAGLLRPKAMTVNNGQPFTVGNGGSPATLELQGGVYNFANGLVISPNATVTGCGTIIGSIVNNGTLSTNCAPLDPIKVAATSFVASKMTVNFSTTNGQSYTLQYTTNLQAPVWTALPPAVSGTGSVMSFADTNTADIRRYYRIHSP